MIRILALAIAACLIWPTPFQSAEASTRRGRIIAERQCAPCHSIERTGKSPLENAPPLRTIAAKYPLENLEEAFAEGIMVTHKGQQMPVFEMAPQTIADVIDFLKSLRPKRK